MPKQQTIWQWMLKHLKQNHKLILMLVVNSKGSSPGKPGAKLAIAEDGSRFGTIGGGAVEYKLINQARALLADSHEEDLKPRLIRELHHPDSNNKHSDMICGGEQTVALYPCAESELVLIKKLALVTANNQRSLLTATQLGLDCLADSETIAQSTINNSENWCYNEIIGNTKTAYIIGGGHVSLALSKVLALLEFNIVVMDEREKLETMINNNDASIKQIVNYQQISDFVPEGEQVFIFVMTHSHRTDELVVAKLAAKKVAYIGVLGSRHKVETLKQNLSASVEDALLNKLHAPMGLAIKSHTPAEIAISIAAELITLVNSARGKGFTHI